MGAVLDFEVLPAGTTGDIDVSDCTGIPDRACGDSGTDSTNGKVEV